jgi:hypothetical protein
MHSVIFLKFVCPLEMRGSNKIRPSQSADFLQIKNFLSWVGRIFILSIRGSIWPDFCHTKGIYPWCVVFICILAGSFPFPQINDQKENEILFEVERFT